MHQHSAGDHATYSLSRVPVQTRRPAVRSTLSRASALKKRTVTNVVSHYALTMRRACRLVEAAEKRAVLQYYSSTKDPRHDLRNRMRELARARVRYGYRRLHVLLRRDGWQLGKNQMYRLYCEEQLQLRSNLPKRRKMIVSRRSGQQLALRTISGAWILCLISWPTARALERSPLSMYSPASMAARLQ
jgi:hypothetical protein